MVIVPPINVLQLLGKFGMHPSTVGVPGFREHETSERYHLEAPTALSKDQDSSGAFEKTSSIRSARNRVTMLCTGLSSRSTSTA